MIRGCFGKLEDKNEATVCTSTPKEFCSSLSHSVGLNDVILYRLFALLTLKDLKNCRRVCSKWKNLIHPLLKSQAIVKFYFEKTNQFLDTFRDYSEEIPFMGISFQEGVDWVHNGCITEFLKQYGYQMTYCECIIYTCEDVLNFRTILFQYMPQLKNLCLKLQLMTFRKISLKGDDGGQNMISGPLQSELNLLERIEWGAYYSNIQPPIPLKTIFFKILSEIIASAKNLQTIVCGSTLVLDGLINLKTAPSLSSLRELTVIINGGFYAKINDTVDTLNSLSEGGLRLSLFSVSIRWKELPSAVSMWAFFKSQQKSLKTLEINILDSDTYLRKDNLPEFPKMEKLIHLKISMAPELLFKGRTTWIHLFPILKTLEFSYHCPDNGMISVKCMDALCCNDTFHNNLRHLRLNNIFEGSERLSCIQDCALLYDLVKNSFPMLVDLKVCVESDNSFEKKLYYYCGNSSNEQGTQGTAMNTILEEFSSF